MWYIQIDDTILPTPYQYFSDCPAEYKKNSAQNGCCIC